LQALIAALVLFSYNAATIGLGIASLALVVIYPFAKRFTWWPQVFLGLAFNWGALVAWTAHSGSLGLGALLLWLSGIAWTLFYDTIYAHQDKDDDALIGVKSTARLFGDQNSLPWLRGFLVIAVLLMTAAVLVALLPSAPSLPKLLLALVGIWGFGWHMAWQLVRLDTTDPAKCLTLFRSNRNAGLIPALFFAGAALL
ncbi:MAG: UbiA family prenyltransferase, partial [Pseudorhodobacter sp.]